MCFNRDGHEFSHSVNETDSAVLNFLTNRNFLFLTGRSAGLFQYMKVALALLLLLDFQFLNAKYLWVADCAIKIRRLTFAMLPPSVTSDLSGPITLRGRTIWCLGDYIITWVTSRVPPVVARASARSGWGSQTKSLPSAQNCVSSLE